MNEKSYLNVSTVAKFEFRLALGLLVLRYGRGGVQHRSVGSQTQPFRPQFHVDGGRHPVREDVMLKTKRLE